MNSGKKLYQQLKILATEQRNPDSMRIDMMDTDEILRLINNEDQTVARAVEMEIPYITKSVELIVKAFNKGGRLIYVGAGTSGRLGILDAAECPPTYGTDPNMVQGLIAGGKKAVFKSQEGAEDKEESGRKDIRKSRVTSKDVICGIAASARTPYVVSAMKEAKKLGAKTIYITTNPRTVLQQKLFGDLRKVIDVVICPDVGSEVIMGSTRMKSGTAQKMVLNMITTTAMIRLGKVYENMMIDLKMNSRKLEERAKRVLMIATGIDYNTAVDVLKKANGHVKTGIVMMKAGVSVQEARRRLRKAYGFVRQAIEMENPSKGVSVGVLTDLRTNFTDMKPELYLDSEIYPPFDGFPEEGIKFLKQLKKNNNRQWFGKHKADYEDFVKLPMQSLIASLKPKMLKLAPEMDVHTKRSMFRIYRDTRFSNNKTPYKTHAAAVFHVKGHHWQESAGFYVHIEPTEIYVGGGIYMPDSVQLKKIRSAIAEEPKDFLSFVGSDSFVKKFKKLEGEKLSRMPLGFPSNHMMGEWLKYKSYYTGVVWQEKECYAKKFIEKIIKVYGELLPLVKFLNNALGI